MENASYRSVQVEKCPLTNTRKRKIQQWLRHKNVNFMKDMTKTELLYLVNKLNKQVEPHTR